MTKRANVAENMVIPTGETKEFDKLQKHIRNDLVIFQARHRGVGIVLETNGTFTEVIDFELSEDLIGKNISLRDGTTKIFALGYMDMVKIGNCYHLYLVHDSFGFLNSYDINWQRPYVADIEPQKSFWLVDINTNTVFLVKEYFCEGNPCEFDFYPGDRKAIVYEPGKGELGLIFNNDFYPVQIQNSKINPYVEFILENMSNGQ